MGDYNSSITDGENNLEKHSQTESMNDNQLIYDSIMQMREDIAYLRDLFVRRLNNDKQKNAIIQKLAEGASFAFIEPFLYDIILLMDRIEKQDDEFTVSVREELYDIISRRGVKRIEVANEFNPAFCKAVKVIKDPTADRLYVSDTVRSGYMLSGKVLRPAEVVVVKPSDDSIEDERT